MFYHKYIVRAVDCMAHSDRIRDTEFTTFTAGRFPAPIGYGSVFIATSY